MKWEELEEVIAGRGGWRDDEGRWMFSLSLAAPLGQQRVEVTPIQVEGEPWISILADTGQLDAHFALVHSATLGVGAVIADGEHYFLRHTHSLPALDVDLFDRIIALIAHEASRLRVAPPPAVADADADAFRAWTD